MNGSVVDPTDLPGRIAGAGLSVVGGFHTEPDEAHLPPGTGTVLLLGPSEPGFWPRVTAEPEFCDGAADPLDRWSRRTICALAKAAGATPLFPFGGPPWLPFIAWAQRCGTIWPSPVGLLIHRSAGLFLSIRGALALSERVALPAPAPNPCETCADRPCLTACPVGALGGESYRTDLCHGHLDTPTGQDCLGQGCAVRRACPVSRSYPRRAEQSAFHMAAFHRAAAQHAHSDRGAGHGFR